LGRQDPKLSAIRFIPVDRFRIAAIACVCLFLAACGGTTKRDSIRRPVALRLANASHLVAAALDAGDACTARARALSLRSQVAAAAAAGSIPSSLASDARAAATRLASAISCAPAPPPPPPATPPPAVAPSCADLDARKHELEQEKHDAKGKAGQARRKEIDQEEHALDHQRKGCHK
jgi:hypothetical protein